MVVSYKTIMNSVSSLHLPVFVSSTFNSKLLEGIRTNKEYTPWGLVSENNYSFISCPWYTILKNEERRDKQGIIFYENSILNKDIKSTFATTQKAKKARLNYSASILWLLMC